MTGLASVAAGAVIGAVEVVLAISFAALVYGGYLADFVAEGITLYLVAATIALAVLALRGGRRGVVGSVQDAAAAVLAVVATTTALDAFGSLSRAFITVVAATMVVSFLTGVTFFALGTFRLGNLVRFVPYPVVGGFLAGTGWLLASGGVGVAASIQPYYRNIDDLLRTPELKRWIPALLFGIVLLIATRVVRRPLVIPTVIAIGLVAFTVGLLVTGASLDEAKAGHWFLGPFPEDRIVQPWTTLQALPDADWSAIVGRFAGIATAVFVAVIAALFNVSGIELILHRDLDSNRELRDAGVGNVVTSIFGGIPGYHALSLTALAKQMSVDARAAGLIAALLPLAAVVFGAGVIALIPRLIIGGVLVYVGLNFIVDWLWDKRRVLPRGEYVVVLAIFVTILAKGLLPGVAVGLVLAVVLFAITYGRVDQITEVGLGGAYRSNVDRSPAERETLRTMGDRVQILRLHGFVFFGTVSALLERIRRRVEARGLRFLLIDLMRVPGVDSSAVMSLQKVAHLAEANGFELVLTGVPDGVRKQLERGGITPIDGVLRFEPDLDRGLQRCEDGLLEEERAVEQTVNVLASLPPGLARHFESIELEEGARLIRQGASPDDVFVLASGRLRVDLETPDGTRMRVGSLRPGAVVGEIAFYTSTSRTADVVAEAPSVVHRLARASIERMEREDPQLAAALHRWFASTLAERLTDSMRAFEALRS